MKEKIQSYYSQNKLIFLPLILFVFWFADAGEKIFIQQSPIRLLWWSSLGLFLIALGILKKNSFILSTMFCFLFIIETMWTFSFISNLFRGEDNILLAKYAFGNSYPLRSFIITSFHLLLVPSLIVGFFYLRRVHSRGWLGAVIFFLITAYIPYFFPDSSENVNCSRELNYICSYFFGISMPLESAGRYVIAAIYQILIIYIPLNLLLLLFAKHKGWRVDKTIL